MKMIKRILKRKHQVTLTEEERLFLLTLLRDEMVTLKQLTDYTENRTLYFAPNEWEKKTQYKIKRLKFYEELANQLYHHKYLENGK